MPKIRNMRFKEEYHLYALITIACWSLAYVLTRLALTYFSVYSLGFWRYFIASLTLLGVAVVIKMKMPPKKDWPIFFLSGALGFFLYMIFFNQGQQMVSAATGSIIIATAPVITALLARIIYREKLTWLQWLAIGLEFCGVAFLTLINGVVSVNIGVLWLFLAALVLSFYNLLQRKLTKSYAPLQTAAYSIFAGTILLAVFLPTSVNQAIAAPPMQWVYVLILGVFSSAIAYVAWTKALSVAEKTSQVSNYMFLTPFLTSVLGFLIAGEIPEQSTIIGGTIILLGVFLFNYGERLKSFTKPRN